MCPQQRTRPRSLGSGDNTAQRGGRPARGGSRLASSGVSIFRLFFARRSQSRIILSAEPVASTCSNACLERIHARGAGWPGPDGAAHVLVGPDGPARTHVRGPGEAKMLRAAQRAAKKAHVGVGWAPAEAVDSLLVVLQHQLLPLLVRFHTPYPHIRAGRCRGKPCAVAVPPQRLDQLAVSLFDQIAWSHTAAMHPRLGAGRWRARTLNSVLASLPASATFGTPSRLAPPIARGPRPGWRLPSRGSWRREDAHTVRGPSGS